MSLFAATAQHNIWFVTPATLAATLERLEPAAAHAKALKFEGRGGTHLIVPEAKGFCVLFGEDAAQPFLIGKLISLLPAADYAFANAPADAEKAALGWLLSAYRFTRYKKAVELPRLVAPQGIDRAKVERLASAVYYGRDLINIPANDLGPEALEAAAATLAKTYNAPFKAIRGEDLLKNNFPLIHAVGRAAAQAPRLVEFSFGAPDAPKVTLVGKGVTYDTGGLDIKPSSAMAIMKKDMGGAATVLALADMLMSAKAKIRLHVVLAIVENSISSNSFRTGDIYPSRKGLTVEIGNTDAEGRLILADALTYADEDKPELLIDFATLTGAARVALGPDLPPFYTDNDALAADIAAAGQSAVDPVWRLPLWQPYAEALNGKISDLQNMGAAGGFAGSIYAALFLKRFVDNRNWLHFDVYGWSPSSKPGKVEGGEIQAARLLYDVILNRFGV